MELRDNLISWWELNETSGTREDAHGSNDLTSNGTGGVGYGTGKKSNAADFENGDSDYLSITDASQSGIDTALEGSAWSINLWFNSESALNGQGLFAKMYNPSAYNGIGCFFNSNWIQCFGDPGNTDTDINFNSTTFNTSTWYMVTITWDGDQARLYKNAGTAEAKDLTNGSFGATTTPFVLGSMYWTGVQNYFDGLIDEVGLWSRALTADEITSLYNSGNGLAYADTAAAASGPAKLKTRDTIAKASVKTIDGIAIASVKTIDTIGS
jgi:hypothetical protein